MLQIDLSLKKKKEFLISYINHSVTFLFGHKSYVLSSLVRSFGGSAN